MKGFAVAGGLVFAAASSQFPEYSQQYMQRLSGAVNELSGVVAQFDADAESVGLTRSEALQEMSGAGRMAEARAISMGYVLKRYERLSTDLAVLKNSTTTDKMLNSWRLTEKELMDATWADFRPAVPVTVEGLAFAGGGFALGYALVAGLMAGLGRLLRRRPMQAPAE